MMAVDCVDTAYKCVVSSRQYQSVLHCRLPQSAFAFYDVPLCVVRIFQGRPLIKQCVSIYSVLLFLVHLVCIHDLFTSCLTFGELNLRTGCLSILIFLTPLAEVTP